MLWVSTEFGGDRGGFPSLVFDAVFWRTGVSDKFHGCDQVQNAVFGEESSHQIDWQQCCGDESARCRGL